ncbi:MAG TPA: IS1182 family transposase [Acidimicrobiales bacterium]|nr:IS1182 family transposase [Acidimicrobiales bacterium]
MRRHIVTKGSFYERLADHGHEIVSDDDFAHLYSERNGRPSIPPSVMVRAMLCATHDRITSDAETSRRTRVDADWKAAMGVDDEFTGIGATTFSLMRSRIVVHDADATLFEKTIEKAVEAGVFKGKLTAIIDSSPVHGAGAVADTYELVRGFLRQVVRAAGERLSEEARKAAEPFCGAKPDIDWGDPVIRKAHLAELVAAGMALLVEAAGIDDPAVREPADLLAQVIDQDVTADDNGDPEIRQGVARDRVISHSDPEMRHGRKSASRRFDGHKADVITDEDSEMILGVEVRPGNAADGEGTVGLLGQVMALPGIVIATLLGDMAYSDGDVRQAVEEQGAELVAKVPPVTNGSRFPKTDFEINLQAGSVTCPAGVTTTDARAARDHKGRPATRFVFAPATCAACPLLAQCTTAKGGRQIMVGVHEARIAAARAAQEDPATKALLRRRSKVERKIDHLQDLGMRKARYRGRRKTRLQALLAATVANFNRLGVLGAFDASAPVAVAA